MNTDHRYIVIGCGGLGSAALYWLSRHAGAGVLGLERDTVGHDRGAGRDHSRIVRFTQHRDAYAALAPAAYETWRDLERVSGQRLVTETGGLVIEDVDARLRTDTGTQNIGGYAEVADRHGIAVELLSADAVTARWPQFRLAGTEVAIYQRRSGIVDARRATATHLALARGHGAEVAERTPVRAVHDAGSHVEVVTDDEIHRAEHVVVAADARVNELLGTGWPLTVTREQVTSYATPNLLDFSPGRFPVFLWHGAEDFSGLPVHGEVATTLGQHGDGHDGAADTRTVEPESLRRSRRQEFLAEHVPGFLGPELCTTTRLHTIPPDRHDVLGPVPGSSRVSVAIGADRGFTFASLTGRILAEIATTGTTRHPIATFAADRPALADPAPARPV